MRGILLLMLGVTSIVATAENIEGLSDIFAQPPREYSTGPLWVWNDLLTEEQIRSTLRDLAGQQVKQVWVHPRPGLMTPYLSEDWFRLWKVSLEEAERLDMNVWIYDENSYPSGFAGGFVPEAMPESRALGMDLRAVTLPGEVAEPVLAVYTSSGEHPEDVTQAYRDGKLPPGDYLVIVQTTTPSTPWYGGTFYVDLLRPGVTQKFLEVTLDRYKAEVGAQFGQRIPGVFTDEPHLASAPGLHWTPDLLEQFQQRRGYDLRTEWLGLWRPVGDWRRVRHDYFRTLLELFIERWAQPYFEYCARNNLEFTGHYWEHGWPEARIAPDNMAMYAWQQRPAIDTLFNQYQEGVHAQFGNVRSVLELRSAANQSGRRRTLCESFGGSSWEMRFEDLKRIGDWLLVLGVNTINEHLSQITNRGARKADYPPSFSYHAPWFENYHVLAQYFTRLSAAMSHGEQINEILVLEPTSTAWMYQGDKEQLGVLGESFQLLVTDLMKAQVEFDLGSEDILERQGAVQEGRFVVGQRAYHTVVIPPGTETLHTSTVSLLGQFLAQGGVVLCAAEAPPARVDGKVDDALAQLAKQSGWSSSTAEQLPAALRQRMGDSFRVERASDDAGILYHHRRQFAEGDLVLLVNTSIEHETVGEVKVGAGGVERWDPETGAAQGPYPATRVDGSVAAAFRIPPCGSLLLYFPKQAAAVAGATGSDSLSPMTPQPEVTITRDTPNVLTLDYLDLIVNGETTKDTYFYQAAQQVFRAHGLEENPWDHAVQFRDQLISKTFPDSQGFEVIYRFDIEERVPEELYFVLERADLYTVTCNGAPIAAKPGEWWLDRSFGKMDIRSHAKVGANEIQAIASGMTLYHEVEPAYVLGSFALRPAAKGFMIVPEKPLEFGSWKELGLCMYGGTVSYTMRFDLAAKAGAKHAVQLG
ncbi:MAG: hypothetical protein HYV26_15470, partial [Candidatus Hydrogenedentes bacterium]|nr:hypothetical protein [Candidatus Hydrogenedentota bacterium]